MKTHINDVTAYLNGSRFAVIVGGHCVGYFNNLAKAQSAATRMRGRVVGVTGNKSTDIITLERNGISCGTMVGLKSNPLKEFEFDDDYRARFEPKTALDRIKESINPGIREVPGLRESPIVRGTDSPVPEINLPHPPGRNYLPHQIAGITAMIRRKNVLLADEQGLGKTIEIIGYINALEPDRTLIVCPSIAVTNWLDELVTWCTRRPLTILVLEGGKFCRVIKKELEFGGHTYEYKPLEDQRNPQWNIVVAKYEEFTRKETKAEKSAVSSLEDEKKGNRISATTRSILRIFERDGLDLLVLDECHMLSKSSKVSKRVLAFFGEKPDPDSDIAPYPGLARFAERKIFASGTPIVNDKPNLIFHWFKALNESVFPDIDSFIDKFGGTNPEAGVKGRGAANHDLHMLGYKLRDTILIRRLADDVLELPPMVLFDEKVRETEEVIQARLLLIEALKSIGYKINDVSDLNRILGEAVDGVGVSSAGEAEQVLIEDSEEGGGDDESSQLVEILQDESIPIAERLTLANSFNAQREFKERAIGKGSVKILMQATTTARVAMGIAKAAQFDRILEFVKEKTQGGAAIKNGKLVIFYNFKSTANIVQQKLLGLGYTEDQIVRVDGDTKSENGYRGYLVRKFQTDPNVKIFLGSISTCSTAITLTAANTAIFMELDWRPGVNLQAMKRIHRYAPDNNLTKAVYEFFPYAANSIDSNIYAALRRKKDVQEQVLRSFPGLSISGGKYYFDDYSQSRQMHSYSQNFVDKDLSGFKYNISQRVKISKAANYISKSIEEEEKDKGYIDWDRLGISYQDLDTINRFLTEVRSKNYKYNGKSAIYTEEFPEELIDAVLPLIWKKKGLVKERSLVLPGGIEFPTSITGLVRGCFAPIRTGHYAVRDTQASDADPLYALLYAITRETRVKILEDYKERRAAAAEELEKE